MTGLHWITPDEPEDAFPPVDRALRDPDGLLAVGGDLGQSRLLSAYQRGIFPWFNPGQPVLWWSPDPRAVLFPENLHISRRLRRRLRGEEFDLSVDENFSGVINGCATTPRNGQGGTWITDEMHAAYCALHEKGFAHSVETWKQGRLVGGIYGVAIGRVFFGESMFAIETDASKVALVLLIREMTARGFVLLDCQVSSAHLATLGSRELPRSDFLQLLQQHAGELSSSRWTMITDRSDLHAFDPARTRA